ncbi:FkbM family methyltransferase [Synechococcus sp. MEDNS5]|uniref:FkbM family methyltransferase n=1 Tax=Synechococcus sp. MEDNS5 TaxID=1442554 RepID=UPI001647A7C4|nr:FkbM family methyltransferase [Synechococcus sp. MEDNS5]
MNILFSSRVKHALKSILLRPLARLLISSSKTSALQALIKLKIPITQIVDVGVKNNTIELINLFPKLHHILFEPVEKFSKSIRLSYAKTSNVLHQVALSNCSGVSYLVERSLYNSSLTTHSEICSEPVLVDNIHIKRCTKIQKTTLDVYHNDLQENFLLKIDVDGSELLILLGSSMVISKASVVIIEASWYNFSKLNSFLVDHNFILFDLVDKCNYGFSMWQCDLIYVNSRYQHALRPPMKPFKRYLWFEL